VNDEGIRVLENDAVFPNPRFFGTFNFPRFSRISQNETPLKGVSQWYSGAILTTQTFPQLPFTFLSMLVICSPGFAYLECALARNPWQGNQYALVFARWYGMAAGREICIMNDSTPPWQQIEYSSGSKHPLLWISPPSPGFPDDDLLRILLAAESPVIRTTGRTKEIILSAGDIESQNQIHVQPEVEILLDEEDLARVCYFCLNIECVYDRRFKHLSGEGYSSLYQCRMVSVMTCLTMPSTPYF